MNEIRERFCPTNNIADDRTKDKAPPIDIVDIFWEYKHDEANPHTRERDFLRHTNIGYWYIVFQLIRPYALFAACVV